MRATNCIQIGCPDSVKSQNAARLRFAAGLAFGHPTKVSGRKKKLWMGSGGAELPVIRFSTHQFVVPVLPVRKPIEHSELKK